MNNYVRIIDELVSTHIYSILHSISIQKRVELKVEILKLIIRYSELIIRIFEYYSIFQKGPNTNTNIIIRSSIIRIFE